MFATMTLAATTLLAAYAADGASEPADMRLVAIERQVIDKVNDERFRRGLWPLRIDRRLMSSARGHAAWMTRNRQFEHTSEPVGENIAMGQPSTREAVRDWMSSPGHRANILSHNYVRVGAAAYVTSDGTIYWCMQFLH